jgi:hypothetical protein
MLSYLSKGVVGAAVVYVYAIRGEIKTADIDMGVFADLFPFGIPSQEWVQKMWEDQKGVATGNKWDNLLDILDPALLPKIGG